MCGGVILFSAVGKWGVGRGGRVADGVSGDSGMVGMGMPWREMHGLFREGIGSAPFSRPHHLPSLTKLSYFPPKVCPTK